MVTRAFAFAAMLVIFVSVVARTQGGGEAEKEVLAALQRLTQAQARCDVAELAKLRVPDHTIIAPSGAMITGDQLSTNDKNCQPHKPSTDEELRVRIYNGNTAIVTGLQVTYGPGDKPLPKRRFSSVWVKVDGAWKHANYQGTVADQSAMAK